VAQFSGASGSIQRCSPFFGLTRPAKPENGRKIKQQMSGRAKHISSSFDAALYGLKNDVLMMSSLTDRIFQTAFEALLSRNSELCDHVLAEDEEIDTLEKQVDQEGVSLLVRFHPVASDMSEVISAMKVSTNLERVGDQSVTIARRAKHLNSRPPVAEVALLESPYQVAVTIFREFQTDGLRAERILSQTQFGEYLLAIIGFL
jgi:phosphate uptake regulator